MRRSAFTLLELTLVLAVAGILLALTAPRFALLRDRAAVQGAMADLGGALSAARQFAIVRRSQVAIVFDTAGGSVDVRSYGQRLLRRTLRTAYGISLGANRDSAVYDARGLGYGASNISVTVRRGSIVDTLTMSRMGRARW
jgi:prepilin-type N-terminal cleavage/methylation domain-containing protein